MYAGPWLLRPQADLTPAIIGQDGCSKLHALSHIDIADQGDVRGCLSAGSHVLRNMLPYGAVRVFDSITGIASYLLLIFVGRFVLGIVMAVLGVLGLGARPRLIPVERSRAPASRRPARPG